ncbi:MAG TPA: 2',3'-cyclic-nucleotide 2'-phosphodiesterase, partial [Paracoccus sp.]|nr:2',3'-cyclic-nucleotide 2'-phosphodiesterase [Paracoccus sp. (in: a-proteobacteria)]
GLTPGLAAPATGASAARVKDAVRGAHEATLAAIRRPVGVTGQPLHTFFAHLTGGAALALISDAQRGFVSARLADPGLKALPMLSAAAPFKAGGRMGPLGYTNVPAGPLLLRHIADLYTFPNAVAALRVTGAEVLDWLERSAAGFNRIAPGSRDMPLRIPQVPGYSFEVIDAIEVTYDLSQPPRYDPQGALTDWTARRVTRAFYQGQPLDPLAEFILCTNSYRASGAGCFAGAVREKLVLGGGVLVRDLLRQHVARLGRVCLVPGRNLRFTAPPGTTAILETSPEAGSHLDEIAGFAPVARGLSEGGFLRLQVALSDCE